jgi:hypothetical protein
MGLSWEADVTPLIDRPGQGIMPVEGVKRFREVVLHAEQRFPPTARTGERTTTQRFPATTAKADRLLPAGD